MKDEIFHLIIKFINSVFKDGATWGLKESPDNKQFLFCNADLSVCFSGILLSITKSIFLEFIN